MPVFCIFAALIEEPTKMIIEEHKASTEAAASMQKSLNISSVHTEAAALQASSFSSIRSAGTAYLFESTSASSVSAMMAESVVSVSSSSHTMEMSAHAEASSSQGVLLRGAKRGETHDYTISL